MQKNSFLLLLLFVFYSTLHAQRIDFGVKGGLNYSDFLVEGDDVFEARSSFHAGFFIEVPFKGKFSFHPELLYSSQGYTTDFGRINLVNPGELILDNDDRASTARNFLAIPLITRFNFTDNLSIEAGPQIGFLLNTVSKFNGERNSSPGDFKFDIGPTLGFGYDIGDKFKVQLRYFIGLSDFLRRSDFEEQGINDDSFDSVFQLSVGYVIF